MSNFFEKSDLSRNEAENIVSETLNKCDDGELYFEDSKSESIVLDDNKIKSSNYNSDLGFGFRAISDEVVAYSHSNEISKDSLKNSAKSLQSTLKSIKGTYNHEIPKTNNKFYDAITPIEQKTLDGKLEVLNKVNDYISKKDSTVNAFVRSKSTNVDKKISLRANGSTFKFKTLLDKSSLKVGDRFEILKRNQQSVVGGGTVGSIDVTLNQVNATNIAGFTQDPNHLYDIRRIVEKVSSSGVTLAKGNVTATGAFVNATTSEYITLAAPTTTIDSDNTIVTGNLVVEGTSTYIDSTNISTKDKTMVLGAGSDVFKDSSYTAADPTTITSLCMININNL